MTITKTGDGRWQVQAGDYVHTSRFLDQALDAALPTLPPSERDRLVVSLIEQETHPSTSAPDEAG